MQTKFNKATDSQHQEKLESTLISALWRVGVAPIGGKASFEVLTAFVGNGADIKITGKSEKGKKLGKVSDKIKNNKFVGEFDIPGDLKIEDSVFFEVDLSGNGIKEESNHIPVVPQIVVTNMKWSAKEAREGDILKMTADVDGVRDDTEAKITIYEFDRDNAHDKIIELKTEVQKNKIEMQWEYQYFEDTDEIPTESEMQQFGRNYNPPEYFFVIEINGQLFGTKQDSGLLTFKHYIEIEFLDEDGQPVGGAKYSVMQADGKEVTGSLDSNGYARIDDIPPGPYQVQFPDNLADM